MAAAVLLSRVAAAQAEPGPDAPRVVPVGEPESEVPTPFNLLEVVVTGNTVLDEKTVYELVEPFLGMNKTLDEVDRIREALEEGYRERGYNTVSVRIPKQSAREGSVRVEVVEGRVARLNVVGSRYHSLERIRALAPSVAPGAVPDFDLVQQDLVALNSSPDLRVTPALKQGVAPNTLDMDLAVDDDLPLHGSIELNNRHGQDTAPLRTQVSVSYRNLWQRGHTLSLAYQTAPQEPEQSQVLVGSYMAPLRGTQSSLLLSYVDSNSELATIGGINVLGAGRIVGLRLFIPLEGTSSVFPTVSLGADYKDFDNTVALPDAGQGEKSFATPITYWPMSLGLGVMSRELTATSQMDVSLNFASPQLGSESAELDDSRMRARGQQFSLRGSFSHTREMFLGLQGVVRGSGQTTDQPLISSEQFSAGGAETVRGYLESAALGDAGWTGSLELRSSSMDWLLPYDIGEVFDDLRVFAFGDAAEVRVRDAGAEQTSEFHLASWGFGYRFRVGSVEGIAQWATPVEALPDKKPEPTRLLFRMTGSF